MRTLCLLPIAFNDLYPSVQFVLCLLFFEHRIFHPFIGVFTSGKDQGGLGRHKSCSGLETKCSVICYEWDTTFHARGRENVNSTCRIFQDKICLYPEINIRLPAWSVQWPHDYALIFIWSGSGLSTGQRHCVVFLGKTLYSPSAFLHLGA